MGTSNINTLLQQCNSGDSVQQINAIDQLVVLEADETIPTLLTLLASEDAVVRFSVVQALTELRTKDFDLIGSTLINLLSDPESIVRSEAVDSLGILQYTPAVEAVKSLLKNDPDEVVRASAAETLGDIGDTTAIDDLELALSDTHEFVRSYATNSLGLLGNQSLLPKLKTYLEKESSPGVKAELLAARSRLGKTEDLEKLLDLLQIANEDLATGILNILTDLGGRKTPKNFTIDNSHLYKTLMTVAERFPILRFHAYQIINKLKK